MRLQHDLVHRQQRGRHMGFVREHVQPGASDAPVRQRGDQRVFVDHAAPADIDDHALWPERVQHGGIDKAGGFRPAGCRDDQHVALPREIDRIGDIAIGRVLRLAAIMIEDFARLPFQPPGNGAADAAQAQYADA